MHVGITCELDLSEYEIVPDLYYETCVKISRDGKVVEEGGFFEEEGEEGCALLVEWREADPISLKKIDQIRFLYSENEEHIIDIEQ